MSLETLKKTYHIARLPASARNECLRDAVLGLSRNDPGIDTSIREAIEWLGRAQDNSRSRDGGVARHYSLVNGWSASYPETTGYIVPTMLEYAERQGDGAVRERAQRMLAWLVSIQFANGAFQGGVIGQEPVVPVTFNTGQILIGLASAVRILGEYREAMIKAADWLVSTQDTDGCWRSYPSPFAAPGEKTYDTHVAWGLFEAARVEPRKPYADAAVANVKWALRHQRDNGWFDRCCLEEPSRPLTHAIGYVLRGVVEAYRFTNDRLFLEAGRKTADGVLGAVRSDGFLPGRLDARWNGAVPWACLTGSVQVAASFLILYGVTGESRYRDAAYDLNRYVRRTVRITNPAGTRGGIKGAFPVFGDYGTYQYLNWAAKFFIDSQIAEQDARESRA